MRRRRYFKFSSKISQIFQANLLIENMITLKFGFYHTIQHTKIYPASYENVKQILDFANYRENEIFWPLQIKTWFSCIIPNIYISTDVKWRAGFKSVKKMMINSHMWPHDSFKVVTNDQTDDFDLIAISYTSIDSILCADS